MAAKIILNIIDRPPWDRKPDQIEAALPWLQMKSELLKDLDKEILIDIVRNCHCFKAEKDEVIIQQGQQGDRMYLILSGSVSVYVDSALSGEDEQQALANLEQKFSKSMRMPTNTDLPQSDGSEMHGERASSFVTMTESLAESHRLEGHLTKDHRKSLGYALEPSPEREVLMATGENRNKYGKFVAKFEAGKCVGELALINKDSVRNATVIADGDCAFLVIKRFLFNSTIRSYEEKEYEERAEFVRSHPLFQDWHPKFQKLLEMSLIRENYGYDDHVIKQGDPWRGLYFLRSGQATITIDANRHAHQYPEMHPFVARNDVFELELGRSSRHKKRSSPDRSKDSVRIKPIESVVVRRQGGYVAAEKRAHHRNVTLCAVRDGEMFGDVEVVTQLPTYMFNVLTTTPSEFYLFSAKNFERLVGKKYPQTLDLLKTAVETKLRNKLRRMPPGQEVPLFDHLYFKLVEEQQPVGRVDPVLHTTKSLPDAGELRKHLVWAFEHNRAELVEPCVPGAVYLREIMREKAKQRVEAARKQPVDEAREQHRKRRKRMFEIPRTTKELKNALFRQREEEEEVERQVMLAEIREREEMEIKRMDQNSVNLKEFWHQIQDPLIKQKNTPSPNPALAAPIQKPTNADPLVKQAQSNNADQAQNNAELPPTGGEAGQTQPSMQSMSVDNISDRIKHKSPGNYNLTKPKFTSPAPNNMANSELDTADDETVRSCSVGAIISPNPGRGGRRDSYIERLTVSLRQKGVQVQENPNYRNWETSDHSLNYLEERIKQFALMNGPIKDTKSIPKLRRFEKGDESADAPRPGGRVVVYRRSCPAKDHTCQIQNHSHSNYNVLPKITSINFEAEKKSKRLVQKILDNKREEWLKAHTIN